MMEEEDGDREYGDELGDESAAPSSRPTTTRNDTSFDKPGVPSLDRSTGSKFINLATVSFSHPVCIQPKHKASKVT
jgi:hypothetical protein